ncbi:MAG: penicillin-binding protein 2 [Alphaproteobacteria bacterium]|nr:penicillin-binding protein 2 [Alphaproteobacteria bacterium]
MKTDKTREKLFSRRAAILAGGQMALFAGLGARMYYLQVLQSERYRTLAEDNRINLRLLAPPRGYILDRFGEPIAINVQNYRIVLIPEQVGDIEATLARLEKVLETGSLDTKRVLRDARRRRAFVPITVAENLSWGEVSRLEVNAPNLPGVNIEVGLSRFYPLGPSVAHVIGYVSSVSEKELTGDPLLELPGFRIGKSGIERRYDAALRGKAGNSQVEVNAFGRVIRELRRDEGEPGREVGLTLDAGLQAFAADRLADERSAATVVMDPHKGDVLAMVSSPGFNPNAFNEGLSNDEWRGLVRDPHTPLINKAIAGQYAPGSTFKVAVALAALEAGIPPEHSSYCRGYMRLGNRRFHCWKKHGHGRVALTRALRESCDIWFYEVALKIGVDRIAAMARRLGFGETHDFDIAGEKAGLIPTKGWKRAALGSSWQKGETVIAAIGQGYVLATPLQLAIMTSRLVNGGFAVTPRLTRDRIEPEFIAPNPDPEFPSLDISKTHRRLVMNAMDQVVNHSRGTARKARLKDPAMAMGGKTGTSQVRRISMAEREGGVRKNKEKPWRERDHALFVGYAPVHAPQYVAAVIVEHGGGGSKVAAPIARDLLEKAQQRDSARHEITGDVAIVGPGKTEQ